MNDNERTNFWDRVRRFFGGASKERAPVEQPRSARFGTENCYWERARVEGDRKKRYEEYAALDNDVPEVTAVLDTYADNSVAGTHGDSYEVTTEHNGAKFAFELLEEATRIKEDTWCGIRDLYQNGDRFVELVPNQAVKTIGAVVRVPPGSIGYNFKGNVIEDPKETFVQSDLGSMAYGGGGEKFSDIEMVHFKLQGGNDQAYGRSILHPLRRCIKQWFMLEDALCIGVLLRASDRTVYQIPVREDTSLEEGMAHATAFMNRIKFRTSFDREGRMRIDRSPITPEEDIVMPTWPDSKAMVSKLTGQTNFRGMLDVVNYFRDKYYGGAQIPKSIGGGDASDVNGKNVITRVDVAFARKCRRGQLGYGQGLRRIYTIQLAIRQIDPEDAKFEILWPPLGIEDELIDWQTKELKAKVVDLLGAMYGPPPAKWVYVKLLGLSEEEVEEYGLVSEPMKRAVAAPEWADVPDNAVAQLMGRSELQRMLRDLCFLLDTKLAWEHRVQGRFGPSEELVGLDRDKWSTEGLVQRVQDSMQRFR